jgi:two-component system LytT family sensor kinase
MRRFTDWQWLFILLAGALLVFATGAVSLYLKYRMPNLLPPDINDATGTWAFGIYWIIYAPLIFILLRRFSFGRERLAKNLLIFSAAGIFWTLLVQGSSLLLLPALSDSAGFGSAQFQNNLINWFGSNFLLNLLIFWLVLSISVLSAYYEQFQNEKLKASQLAAQLSNARLQSLKMQIHPHFLFNTLHSISALVLKNENRDAVKMINRLSELLRLALDNMETQIVALADEIEFTRRYLEIEHIRFQDRLSVEWEIEPAALTAEVPNLILQPLVENAMRHGVDSNADASRLQIAARRVDNRLFLQVRDDGKNAHQISVQNDAAGLGLKNTRARLAEIYGDAGKFSLARENEWTIAQIEISFSAAQKTAQGAAK